MQGKVEICGANTAELPVLKQSQMRALLERARAGREELISGNLRQVLSVVQKFANRGESMDDLFQVGVIGLIKAVDCFDLSQNVQFSTYGVPAEGGVVDAGFLRDFLQCELAPVAQILHPLPDPTGQIFHFCHAQHPLIIILDAVIISQKVSQKTDLVFSGNHPPEKQFPKTEIIPILGNCNNSGGKSCA